MFIDILNEFADKNVEVTISSGKVFDGELKYQATNDAVILTPVKEYTARHYGSVFIKGSEIVSIREILPFIDDDDENACDTEPVYKQLSRAYQAIGKKMDEAE